MRLIDADVAVENIEEWLNSVGTALIGKGLSYTGELMGCIEDTQTVDAVPVVRCRDCRYCDPSNGIFWCDRFDSAVQIDGMAYCSYGKQKLKEEEEITNERVD